MFSSNSSTVSGDANYIEDVFSTYLYTGNGSTQTINNGIDLAGKGGLVWFKPRNTANNHNLIDSARGLNKFLITNSDAAQGTTGVGYGVSSFNSTGFSLDPPWTSSTNTTDTTQVAWTFRKQPKFFEIVTYTGNGTERTIGHNLGSTPGCIIVKELTVGSTNWCVYHRGLPTPQSRNIYLNATDASGASNFWNNTSPTSTVFSLGTSDQVNGNGQSYIAYIYAHDAGGFGLTGTDNVISCGACLVAGNAVSVNLGFEPQWILLRQYDDLNNWYVFDNMRGLSQTGAKLLRLDGTNAEQNVNTVTATATGFSSTGVLGNGDYIYIAIRRGPMAVPELGTSVFGLSARTGTGANATVTGSAGVSDAVLVKNRGSAVASLFSSRLTNTGYLVTSDTAAEVAAGTTILQANPWDVMDGVKVGTTSTITNASAATYINYLFGRAPGFFDEVCYTGTGSTQTQAHNLGAIPELMIFKQRTGTARSWGVYVAALGNANQLLLNSDSNVGAATTLLNSTSPTASIFTVGSSVLSNQNGSAIVAYLFATCAGVSKVGNYTGTGTTQAINCGFTAGARFVLIKRTDSTGDWYVWDSARGIVSGNDSYLLLNSTAAEVTGTDYIDPSSAGFEISSTAPDAINASGGSFVFLAVA